MGEILKNNGSNKRKFEASNNPIEIIKKPKIEEKYREHLKEFIDKVIVEKKLKGNQKSDKGYYKLANILGCHETTIDRFMRDDINMPSSKTIVALADYMQVSLDEVVGRDLAKEIELKKSKEININKKEVESKIPAFLTQLPKEALQSVMEVRGKTAGFAHKSVQKPNETKKSFAGKEQAKRSNKQTERSC